MKVLVWLLVFMLVIPSTAYTKTSVPMETTILLRCGVGNCVVPRKRDEHKSTHIAFTLQKGKDLLEQVRVLRSVVKAKDDLLQTKVNLKNERIDWLNVRLKQSEKAVNYQREQLVQKSKKLEQVEEKNKELVVEVAKYKGERYMYLAIGIGTGVVVVGLIIGSIAIYNVVK